MQKKKQVSTPKSGKNDVMSMPILNLNAAGIDVSATGHAVAVRPDVDEESVSGVATFERRRI